jgi:hypothetical protein
MPVTLKNTTYGDHRNPPLRPAIVTVAAPDRAYPEPAPKPDYSTPDWYDGPADNATEDSAGLEAKPKPKKSKAEQQKSGASKTQKVK